MSSSGGGKVRAKRWNREKGENGGELHWDVVSLNTAYISSTPSLSLSPPFSLPLPSIRGGWRAGKDGLRRKDEVCNWCNICGLQDGINVCSLRALSLVYSSSSFSHFLPPPLPPCSYLYFHRLRESLFFPYHVISFSLLFILSFNCVCMHFSDFFGHFFVSSPSSTALPILFWLVDDFTSHFPSTVRCLLRFLNCFFYFARAHTFPT